MNDQAQPYPLKVTSRSLSATRTTKLRVSWFIVGTAFGIGCTAALMSSAQSVTPWKNSALTAAPSVSVAAAQPAQAPVAKADDVAAPVVLSTDKPDTAAPEQVADNSYPQTLTLTVKNGDTLINLLTDAGVPHDEAYNVFQAIKSVYDPKRLDIGQNLSVELNKGGTAAGPIITALALPISATASLEVKRKDDNSFDVKKVDAPVEKKLSRAGGKIDGSLYQTGIDNGIPASLLNEVIQAYSYDVDFQRDIKEGDAMDVLYESLETKDGVVAGHGDMIFAELDLGDRTMKLYRFVDADGHASYYNEKGETIRKALLRTPINGATITSGYGMRNHPILGYSKMHRGIDFGAPTGTPIYAAGDGTVEFEGRKGGYGNYLKIHHNGMYSSAYGHISRFAENVHVGSHVKQGEVVAYVGATGMATGPAFAL